MSHDDQHRDLSKHEPALYKTTLLLSQQAEAALLETGLSAHLLELVKIRVSQLNGCAFCLRMHTGDAIAKGVALDKVAVLPAWRESGYFDEAERDALALAERVTHIDGAARAEELEPTTALDPSQAAAVAWVAVVMNVFNRIAITSHFPVVPA